MLSEARLRRVLAELPLVEHRGHFHRFVQLQHVLDRLRTEAPLGALDAIGSRLGGGRFNRRGRFEVLYLAFEAETALMEAESVFLGSGAGTRGRLPSPYIHLGIDGRVRNVLDLTDDQTLERLGTTREELASPWRLIQARGGEAPTQVLGRLARQSGRIEALCFWSTKSAAGGRCLAVFSDRLARPSELIVADESGRLPRERVPMPSRRRRP